MCGDGAQGKGEAGGGTTKTCAEWQCTAAPCARSTFQRNVPFLWYSGAKGQVTDRKWAMIQSDECRTAREQGTGCVMELRAMPTFVGWNLRGSVPKHHWRCWSLT